MRAEVNIIKYGQPGFLTFHSQDTCVTIWISGDGLDWEQELFLTVDLTTKRIRLS